MEKRVVNSFLFVCWRTTDTILVQGGASSKTCLLKLLEDRIINDTKPMHPPSYRQIPHNARYKPGAPAHNAAQAVSPAALQQKALITPSLAWPLGTLPLVPFQQHQVFSCLSPFSSCKSGSCKPFPFPAHWFPLAHPAAAMPTLSHAMPCHIPSSATLLCISP